MPVVDKYRPVQASPRSLSSPGPVLLAGVALAAALALLSPDTLRSTALHDDDLPAPAREVLLAVAELSEATGAAAVRRTLEAWSAPLDDTARLLRRPLVPVAPGGGSAEPPPPPEPDVPPGERWAARALHDRVHRVLIVGASSIQYAVGTELERELRERYEGVEVLRKGKVSTGLTRDDVFDWPAEIARLMDEFQPQVVIAQFGGNDGQNIVSPTEGPQEVYTEGWEREYGRRLTALTEAVEGRGAELIVLGMPVMRSKAFDRKMRWVDDITERHVEAAGGVFVPITDLSADEDGAYLAEVRHQGRSGRMRQDDGIHFTRLGGQHVAWHLARRLEREMRLVPRAPEDGPPPAVAYRLDVPSYVRGTTPLLAYVPQEVPPEGLPVWFLLHGAWDGWTAWPDRAHDRLQALAAEHRVVIVSPDGEPFGYWLDGTADPDHRIATWFFQDLLPFVDRQLPSNGRRAYSGNSMGGHGALTLALADPDAVVAVTSMSGAVDLPRSRVEALEGWLGPYADDPVAWESRSALHLLRERPRALAGVDLMLSCGRADRWWWAANQALHAVLEEAGVPHAWDPQDGGHTWDVWLDALPRHAAFVAEALHRGAAPPPVLAGPEQPETTSP